MSKVAVIYWSGTGNTEAMAGADAEGVGGIVGSGFFSEELAANGAPFDQPTQFELVDCTAE